MDRAAGATGTVSGQKVMEDIARHGWHFVSVHAGGASSDEIAGEASAANGAEHGLSFAYTVGLYHTYRQPELIVFGLPALKAQLLLQRAAGGITARPPLEVGAPLPGLLPGSTCLLVDTPLPEQDRRLAVARWYYAGNAFALRQIVWSSAEGYFPWHSRAPHEFKLAQPILARNRRAGDPAGGHFGAGTQDWNSPPLRRRPSVSRRPAWPSGIVSRLRDYFAA